MQRSDEFQTVDLIDLGAASVETKGGTLAPDPDTPPQSAPNQYFNDGGISVD